METKPGTKIMKYTLVRIIGTGGWGEVWEARNEINGETVAVKILRPGGGKTKPGKKARERFSREAEVMCRLQSPWLCHAYSCCDDEDAPFMAFVMEYIQGRNLSEHVRKYGPPQPDQIRTWLYQLLSALDEIHNRGIVHRDIKPSNIMLQPSGDIKLFDFGICKDLTVDYETTHTAVYSTYYAAPEQKMGDPDAPLDAITDYYSLGKTLWFLATGKTPPAGEITKEHLDAVQDEELARAIEAFTLTDIEQRRAETKKYIASVEGLIPDELPTMTDEPDELPIAEKEAEKVAEAPTMVDETGVDVEKPNKSPGKFKWIFPVLLMVVALGCGIGAYYAMRGIGADHAQTIVDTVQVKDSATQPEPKVDENLTANVEQAEPESKIQEKPEPEEKAKLEEKTNLEEKEKKDKKDKDVKPVEPERKAEVVTPPAAPKYRDLNINPDDYSPRNMADNVFEQRIGALISEVKKNPTAKNVSSLRRISDINSNRIDANVSDRIYSIKSE